MAAGEEGGGWFSLLFGFGGGGHDIVIGVVVVLGGDVDVEMWRCVDVRMRFATDKDWLVGWRLKVLEHPGRVVLGR